MSKEERLAELLLQINLINSTLDLIDKQIAEISIETLKGFDVYEEGELLEKQIEGLIGKIRFESRTLDKLYKEYQKIKDE